MANMTSYTHNLQTMTDTDVWEDRGIDRREGLMNLILHQTNVATKARRISTLAPRMLPSEIRFPWTLFLFPASLLLPSFGLLLAEAAPPNQRPS